MTSMKDQIAKKLDKQERAYLERLEVLRRLVMVAVERGELTGELFKKTLVSLERFDEWASGKAATGS